MDKTFLESLPEELKSYSQWVAWRGIDSDGKVKKQPLDPNSGRLADVTDPDSWGTFDRAYDFYCKNQDASGIGFVFTDQDPFIGIDLDKCRDPKDGSLNEESQKIVNDMSSYTEISPSGAGLHIIVKGELPPGGRKKGNFEVYSGKRFFTVTGNLYRKNLTEIADRNGEIRNFHERVFGAAGLKEPKAGSLSINNGVGVGSIATLSQEEENLVATACKAANGHKFKALLNGDILGHKSASEADLAFCRLLAFWTANDPQKIDRIFRSSGLFREKWDKKSSADGKTYGQKTIEEAINLTVDVYSSLPEPKQFNRTDLGNSERLIYHFGDKIRYCGTKKKWFVWDGKRWAEDSKGQVIQLAKRTVRRIYLEAKDASDREQSQALAVHAGKSEAAASIRSMIALSKTDEKIAVAADAFDADNWMISCKNGTLDLRTGELLTPDPNHMITKLAPVAYDKDAKCPKWDAFLMSIMGGSEDLIRFLQRAIGYCLTGSVQEQCFFIFYGTGANGKSTLLQTVRSMLGDHSIQTPAETLLVRPKGRIPNDIARLSGARLVTASEAENGDKLAESLIKEFTGTDTVSARYLNQEYFDFNPTFKIVIGTNYKPVISGNDEGIWRRIHLVPFNVTIPEAERDKRLLEKLKQELPGILAWAVRGCLEWQRYGLGVPSEVQDATRSYRTEMDVLSEFIEDCCSVEESAKVAFKQLYYRYSNWADSNGEIVLSKSVFGRKLTEKGFKTARTGTTRYRIGLELLKN